MGPVRAMPTSPSTALDERRPGRAVLVEGAVVGGKYAVKRLLGRGGMGAVYEARHVDTGRVVALKVLWRAAHETDDDGDDANARSSERLARFAREARVVGDIRSPHVVEIFDAGITTESDTPFLAMEYLHGEDLSPLSNRLGPLPPRTVIKLGIQCARGLAAAHARAASCIATSSPPIFS